MKITILNWRDPVHPLAGGAEQSLFQHAKFWSKKGAEVNWISSRFDSGKTNKSIDGIKILRIGSHYTVHLNTYLNFRKEISQSDIVIDCFHFLPFFSPLYINKDKVIALINEPAKNAWFKNIFFPVSIIGYLLEPFFFRIYKNVPFITSAVSIKKELKDLGVNKKYINVIPHGITVPKSYKKFLREKNPTVLYLSQVSPDKGIEDALRAVSILKNKVPNLKFWVAGKAISKKYELEIKKAIKELGIYSQTEYLGFVSEEKKAELFQKAWLLMHPSIREGWGLNVIEANYFNLPAVGYNVTGLRDSIKNNSTGLLASQNSPNELARKCQIIILSKKIQKKLSTNAKKWSAEFSWENSGIKSWSIINTVYERNKRRPS